MAATTYESIREVTKTIHKITFMLKFNEDNSMHIQ